MLIVFAHEQRYAFSDLSGFSIAGDLPIAVLNERHTFIVVVNTPMWFFLHDLIAFG